MGDLWAAIQHARGDLDVWIELDLGGHLRGLWNSPNLKVGTLRGLLSFKGAFIPLTNWISFCCHGC